MDYCSETSCGPSGCKFLLKQLDVQAWKRLYRHPAGCHRHIDERIPGCWFLTTHVRLITVKEYYLNDDDALKLYNLKSKLSLD